MKIKIAKTLEARCGYCDARFTIGHGGERTKVPVYTINHRCI